MGSVLERARASSRTLPDPPLCTRRRGDPAEGARRDVHKRMGEATAVPQRVVSFAALPGVLGPKALSALPVYIYHIYSATRSTFVSFSSIF